jgi:hypothetical protein
MWQDPLPHDVVDEFYRRNIRRLIKRGAYTPPATHFEGARYFPMDSHVSQAEAWEQAKELWAEEAQEP